MYGKHIRNGVKKKINDRPENKIKTIDQRSLIGKICLIHQQKISILPESIISDTKK